jgi:hypothetical protein
MCYQAVLNRQGVYRILLEQCPEGTYVNVFDNENATGPCLDWLQDDVEMAMRACEQDYGVVRELWQLVPDEHWH